MHSDLRHRVAWLVLLIGLVATGVVSRLYVLQVTRGDSLRAQARRQHQQRIQVLGRRGGIVDRDGRELAVSLETWSLFAHPARVPDKVKAARLLAPLLELPLDRVLARLQSGEPFVWLKRRLDPAVADAIRRLDLPVGKGRALDFEMEGKRFYPRGSLAAHVIGFADIDQKGIEGTERTLDDLLQCGRATYLATLDAKGGMVLQRVGPEERRPEDVVLTLDLVLQHVVERELDRAMKDTGAKAASAILLDPRSGQVLALANRPTADLNDYGTAPSGARKNRAVTDLYEPGSTFKIVGAAAALDQGKVSPDQLFDCENGELTLPGGHTVHDHERFRLLTLRGVLEHSSNVGMIKVVRPLPKDVLHDYVKRFGFGGKTGIELPGETAGLLSAPSRWSATTQPSLAMGYEIGVTALQMAAATAALANGGTWYPPRVVLGTRSEDGTFHPAPAPQSRRVVAERTARTMASLMEGVIEEGTGKQAWVAGYRIAGKTGTARKSGTWRGYSTDKVPSFVGFGPSRNPRLAGLVVLDSPVGARYYGGQVAAPVFARILGEALAHLRIPPDEDPLVDEKPRDERGVLRAARRDRVRESAPEAEPVFTRMWTAPGQMPDVRGLPLRAAISVLGDRGCRTSVRGSGFVTGQTPAPATPLAAPAACAIALEPGKRGLP
ncbi:MAG TPA: penicillin-binding transpeptidase domain-containing protein [Candidatus Polarisedimenticolaceae bacterium]|nr:penicillin-binding transpeptidase domain-containing protein [Candidatus Polarisedimenticolaceae bacterium]